MTEKNSIPAGGSGNGNYFWVFFLIKKQIKIGFTEFCLNWKYILPWFSILREFNFAALRLLTLHKFYQSFTNNSRGFTKFYKLKSLFFAKFFTKFSFSPIGQASWGLRLRAQLRASLRAAGAQLGDILLVYIIFTWFTSRSQLNFVKNLA